MEPDRIQPMAKVWQFVRRSSPVVASTLGGVVAGVALVISCQMGPPEGMAQTTTGGGTGGTTSAGTTGGGATSGGTTGGATGGGTGGGTTGGGTTGGCGGSCTCTLTGPVTLAGPVKGVAASEDSAQLVAGQVPCLTSSSPGVFDCTAIAQNGMVASNAATAVCVKLADGPLVLTDVVSQLTLFTQPGLTGTTWVFAAPPASTWDATTRARWSVSQGVATAGVLPSPATGMHYLLNAGESLYGVAVYFTNTCVSFSWAGFKPYQ